ncbi:MAG TPA: sensor histidine kinase [Cytophagales bacterium]|nr:sensor histidine kinase [Cytophagales bacterium]HAP61771.1 sensor histidine kinase [Cytophagales bacterium]
MVEKGINPRWRRLEKELPLVNPVYPGKSPVYPANSTLCPNNWGHRSGIVIFIMLKKHRVHIAVVFTLMLEAIFVLIRLKPYTETEDSLIYERWFDFTQGFLVLLVLYSIFQIIFTRWKQYRQLKNEHLKAQLSLLKNQIDPHFFFNTLNNLYGLSIEKSDLVGPYILKMSEMMRYTIYRGAQETVLLEEEVEYLRQYIGLHEERYHKEVEVQFDVNMENPQLAIAPLLFINLLENAFKHGVEPLAKEAYVHVRLQATMQEVAFEIRNNYLRRKNADSEGKGLKNLQQRLSLIYPKKHQLEIKELPEEYQVSLKIEVA